MADFGRRQTDARGQRICMYYDDLDRLTEDPGLRQRLAENGRDYALAHLGLERMALLTLGVYANGRRTFPAAPLGPSG